MAGYNGYSMSNNAVRAYDNGEKPLSKWTKVEILNSIEDLDYNIEMFKKLSLAILKRNFLKWSSWHHTGKHYNRTDFYELDIEIIEEYIKGEFELIQPEKKEKEKENKKEMIEIRYPIWGGTRNNPRITGYATLKGEKKGDWCVSWCRKKISGNGVLILREWTE